MDRVPFDPSKPWHKSIAGSTPAGEILRLRVVLPRNTGVTACYLTVLSDTEDDCVYSMNWESTDGIEEWWYIDYTPAYPQVLFYHFTYDSPWGTAHICPSSGESAVLFRGGFNWQLTVFDPSFTTPDKFKGGIIYQIFPDRFHNSKTPKNGVPCDRIIRNDITGLPFWQPDKDGITLNNDYFGGDLEGIRLKLPYIASLGVNCIYLNPICEAHSNHRYDTADYKNVDPLLGTAEDFRRLCTAAHALDIFVIIDGVYSHTGSDSIYFNKYGRYSSAGAYQSENSPYYSWYTFRSKDDYDCWWGIKILPEVNENDPSFTEFITGKNGVINYWLSLGADGIRLDVADELPDEFLDNVRKAVKSNSADNFLLGEVWEDASNKISFGKRRRYLLGKQLDSVMNYPFRTAIIDFMLTGSAERFMNTVYGITLNYPPQSLSMMMNMLGTHDTERILTHLCGINCDTLSRDSQASLTYSTYALSRAIRLLKMAAVLLYTLPGIPSIYYGDEAGMLGGKDPFNRKYFPWGEENTDILNFYKLLGSFRRNEKVLATGSFYPVSAALGCVAFMRADNTARRLLVIANKNPDEITYRLNGDMYNMTPLFGGSKVTGGVVIPPETCTVLVD